MPGNRHQVFRGANVKYRKLTTSHCTEFKSAIVQKLRVICSERGKKVRNVANGLGYTRQCVQSPLVAYEMRKGGDFFYGKSNYENYP